MMHNLLHQSPSFFGWRPTENFGQKPTNFGGESKKLSRDINRSTTQEFFGGSTDDTTAVTKPEKMASPQPN
jgi:hypothetical protein